ncbi:MAG TPA: N-acetyl sugar amidotransferase, partial [Bacteroidia bacterium]|nr:N-acetyl sugar amidotransferase [Bacteroidia bacterium]
KRFGKIKKIKSFPVLTLPKLLYYAFAKRIKDIRVLEYMDYNKKAVDKVLTEKLDWEYYGGHHHENVYTKFFQSYYLPKKFNIDKRKTELSALIRSGQIKREDALNEINSSAYQYDPTVVEYTINKLGLSKEEFDKIMNSPNKTHDDYPNYLPLIKLMKFPIKIATKLKLLPHILYLKYASN